MLMKRLRINFYLVMDSYNYAYINPSLIKSVHQNIDIGAHNGYLAILVQYGIFFSLPIFVLLFLYTYKIYAFIR